MIRRRLTLQLALVMLLVALAPLAGAGFLILRLIDTAMRDQMHAAQEQLLNSGSAMVKDYLKTATTKLKSIAQMIRKDEDPQAQTKRLDALLDPPDLFLEVGYWRVGKNNPEVQAQAQQREYNSAQAMNKPGNRAYNPRVGQQVQILRNDSPILNEAANGREFIGDSVDNVGTFNGLPLSVPAPDGAVLTATLDLQPLSRILESLAGSALLVDGVLLHRRLTLLDRNRKILAISPGGAPAPPVNLRMTSLEHGGWWLAVEESHAAISGPLESATRQALLGFVLAFVLAIALAFTFAGRVVLPLRSLAQKADDFGRGHFHVRSEILREDEIGQLGQAFDRMAAAVQQLDQAKDDFVAHVSHELRTPLTSAKVALANVREGIGGPDALARVQQDLDRLIRMVNTLLDAAKLEAGISLQKQATDFGALVRSAADSLRPLAKVPLNVGGTGDTIELDPARVQEIVVNLVDNALKYAKSRVDVELRGRELRVTDDGPGVAPEHRERIFEKFSKVETGPKPPGAGLGLSISRKLARLHGGSLVCEGNTFVLTF